MNFKNIKQKLLDSKLFKDSFWAVFGNGIGNGMMLLAGILIARFLGKDLYGEYGVVKTTMFYIASFATFGLGFTSTKYIAQFVSERPGHVKNIIRDAMLITILFSSFIALLLIVFARPIAEWVELPSLKVAFQFLAGIIVFKAITTTQIGLLSGYKKFRVIALNSMFSGVFMLVACVPLTYYCGLRGSLLALFLSQAFNAAINYYSIRAIYKTIGDQEYKSYFKELVAFSFPVALQESSFTVCHWAAVMFLTKYASAGDLGLYSAGGQWNSIIVMIPALLNNVVLSYLSGNISNKDQHTKTVKTMILVNLVSTFVPFVFVYIFAGLISSFYGPTFTELPSVLKIMTFSTIFECCTSVFKSELMSQGRTWLLFALRLLRDVSLVLATFFVLSSGHYNNGAIAYAWIGFSISTLFFIMMFAAYMYTSRHLSPKNIVTNR